jgi:surface protein
MGDLFNGCFSLSSLPDISKWNIDNVTNIKYLFNDCKSLSSLPDISKLKIDNVSNL